MEVLVRTIAMALVDDPENVSVSVVDGRHTMLLSLKVSKEDTGKVIGRQGRTAGAIRTILSAAGAKNKKRVFFEIEEDKAALAISYKGRTAGDLFG